MKFTWVVVVVLLVSMSGCGSSSGRSELGERERLEKLRLEEEYEKRAIEEKERLEQERKREEEEKIAQQTRDCANAVNHKMQLVFKAERYTDSIVLTNPMESGWLSQVSLTVKITAEAGKSDQKKVYLWKWSAGEEIRVDGFEKLSDMVVVNIRGEATYEKQKIIIAPRFPGREKRIVLP